jgi:hypothetical protein
VASGKWQVASGKWQAASEPDLSQIAGRALDRLFGKLSFTFLYTCNVMVNIIAI